MKKFYGILTMVFALMMVIACAPASNSAQAKDVKKVDEQQSVYAVNQPIPTYNFSLERDTVIQLYNARNQALSTYSVITTQGTGERVFACPSIGFPIQADVQLTNPLMPYSLYQGSSYGVVTVEQPEPNGLFSSKNTDATYVRCTGADGKTYPVYTEHKVTTFPFAVRYDEDQHIFVPVDGAKPSLILENKSR